MQERLRWIARLAKLDRRLMHDQPVEDMPQLGRRWLGVVRRATLEDFLYFCEDAAVLVALWGRTGGGESVQQ